MMEKSKIVGVLVYYLHYNMLSGVLNKNNFNGSGV